MHPSTQPPAQPAAALPPRLPEVDIYGLVHKGIRFSLLELLRRMGSLAPTDTSPLHMTLDDMDGVVYMLDAHSGHEDRHVHRWIEARAPGSLGRFEASHEQLSEATGQLRSLMAAVLAAHGGSPERPALYRRLYLRYAAFVGDSLLHMTEEEEVLQPLLESLYSPDELRARHAALVGSLGPEESLMFLRVMVAASAAGERPLLLARAPG